MLIYPREMRTIAHTIGFYLYEQDRSAEGVSDRDKEVCLSFEIQESEGPGVSDYGDEFDW